MKVLAIEKPHNFHVLRKTQFRLYLCQFSFETDWSCIEVWAHWSRVFIKMEAIGASFWKTVHVSP